jgi:hypothetical protein
MPRHLGDSESPSFPVSPEHVAEHRQSEKPSAGLGAGLGKELELVSADRHQRPEELADLVEGPSGSNAAMVG